MAPVDVELVVCPIDKVHVLHRCRLLKHLFKCIENNGGREVWSFCPNNTTHCVKKVDLVEHILACNKALEEHPLSGLLDNKMENSLNTDTE